MGWFGQYAGMMHLIAYSELLRWQVFRVDASSPRTLEFDNGPRADRGLEWTGFAGAQR